MANTQQTTAAALTAFSVSSPPAAQVFLPPVQVQFYPAAALLLVAQPDFRALLSQAFVSLPFYRESFPTQFLSLSSDSVPI